MHRCVIKQDDAGDPIVISGEQFVGSDGRVDDPIINIDGLGASSGVHEVESLSPEAAERLAVNLAVMAAKLTEIDTPVTPPTVETGSPAPSWSDGFNCDATDCIGGYASTPATLEPFYSSLTDDGYTFPAVTVGRQMVGGVTGLYLEIQRPAYRLDGGQQVEAAQVVVALTDREARSLLTLISERVEQPQ